MNIVTTDGVTALLNKIKDKFILKSSTTTATTVSVDNTPTSGSNNLISSGGVYSAINNIEIKIPSQASSSNQLADKDFVNSSISTSTATFRGTVTASDDTESAAQTALATISTKDDNDYAFVVVPNTPQEGTDKYKRYKYDGSAWNYEYTLNNSSFTSAQWSAINSGVTSAKTANWDTAYGWGNHANAGYLTSHQSLSGYATESWVQGRGYLTGITKAMVENVLTGDISSHTHSYLPLSGGFVSGGIWGPTLTDGISVVGMVYNNNYGGIALGSKIGSVSGSIFSLCYPTRQGIKANGYYGGNPHAPMYLDFYNDGVLRLYTAPISSYVADEVISDWTANTIYHSGNCNNTSTPWSASSLTLSGNLTTSGNILSSAAIYGGSIVGCNIGDYYGFIQLDTTARKVFLTAMQNNVEYLDTILCGDGGNVGIGTSSPSYKLDVRGDIVATGTITPGSDKRWKKDINYNINSNVINELKPCEWNWKEGHGEGHCAGLIAQDVKEILPYAVKGTEENGYFLNYDVLHAFEIKAIQELKAENERLKAEIIEIKNMLLNK